MKPLTLANFLFLFLCPYFGFAITHNSLNINEDEFENVTKLALNGIDLSKEQLNFSRFPNLNALSLRSTNIRTFKKSDLAALKKVKVLDLSDNPLLDLEHFLSNYPESNSLQSLTIENSALLYIPMELKNLNSLIKLDLSGNSIIYLPENVKYLNQLSYVDLSDNQLATMPFGVMSWQKLKRLDLANNVGLSPESVVEILEFVPEIESINMSGMIRIPRNVKNLKSRTMTFNQMRTADLPEDIAENTSLNCLSLNGQTELDKNQIKVIRSLKNIDQLIIESNHVVNTAWLYDLKHLKMLNISRNDVSLTEIESLKSALMSTEIHAEDQNSSSRSFGINIPVDYLRIDPIINKVVVTENTTLTFESGTEIEIPANSIRAQNGEKFIGAAFVSFTEYRDQLDVFVSGVPMEFQQNGENVQMSSAGMFNIEFVDEKGNELAVESGQIKVEMQVSSMSEEYAKWQLTDSLWQLLPNEPYEIFTAAFINPFPFGSEAWKNWKRLKSSDIYSDRVDIKLKVQTRKKIMDFTFFERNQKLKMRDKNLKWDHLNILTNNSWRYAGDDFKNDRNQLSSVIKKINHANRDARKRDLIGDKYEKTSPNLILDTWLTANSTTGDAFIMNIQMLQDTIQIPVLPIINSEDAFVVQKKTAEIFNRLDKKRSKSLSDWASIQLDRDQQVKTYEADLKKFERTGRSRMYDQNKFNTGTVRGVTIMYPGFHNVDRILPETNRTPILAQITDDSTGEKLDYQTLYVLDKVNNTVSLFEKFKSPKYTKNGQCSLIAILPKNQLAFCSADQFDLLKDGSSTDQIPLTVLKEEISLSELRTKMND
ncbi:MAG: hypothetical protein ACI9J3_001565 [Parvicellaceae bacterium]|jgi:hypothetical protein